MQNTLWAVHDAAQLIRAPLAKFYDSLTDEQKQKFAAPAAAAGGSRARRAAATWRGCATCRHPTDAPMRQIEQSLRPTKAQRASLEALQKKSFEMGQFLMASCLKPMPATPAERLDAAADRLTAVIFAASNVNMALNDFTSQLSDEQKTKLNSLVRLTRRATSHPELDGPVVARRQVAIARQRPQREELRIAVVAQIEHARETRSRCSAPPPRSRRRPGVVCRYSMPRATAGSLTSPVAINPSSAQAVCDAVLGAGS